MRINLTIRPETRYKSDRIRLYAHFTWTENGKHKSTRRSTTLTVFTKDWNFKKGIVSGNSIEATSIRDRIFKATDFARTLDLDLSNQNIAAVLNFIKGLGINQGLKLERFCDFVDKFIKMNGSTYAYNTLRKYGTLIRNIELFCCMSKYTDAMQTMSEDQQVVFFSEYVDFLIGTEVHADQTYLYFNGQPQKPEGVNLSRIYKSTPVKKKLIKRKYENASVKEDFKNIKSICETFTTGVSISLARFTQGLRMGNTQGTSCSWEELVAIYNATRNNLTEEKVIDCFLFQVFTGLRHNELYQIEISKITTRMIQSGHIRVLTYVANKNGDVNTVPLNGLCESILDKWSKIEFTTPQKRDPKTKKTQTYPNCLLPVLNSAEFNQTLHSFLSRIPGMDREVSRVRFVGDVRKEEAMPRYMEITDHAARHTYSRLLTEGGLSVDDASKLLNHASAETTNKHYKHLDADRIIEKAHGVLGRKLG